jgi:iron-sulfur cluster insertion protein
MITLDQSAVDKISEILAEENNPAIKLRVFVQGGGCSGFSYGFTLDEIVNEDDFDIEEGGIHVLVDAMSAQYLQGAKIRYKDELWAKEFVIENPNAESTCGCGSSFSI